MDDFYDVIETSQWEARISCVIRFNEDHEIFKGHFPSMPIVPGVCMIRVVQELMEEGKSVKLKLSSADNIKFLSVIDPRTVARVSVNIDYLAQGDGYQVQAVMLSPTLTYFKLKGRFTIV